MHIDDQVIFIHNLRAAGTSIRRALLHGADPNKNIPYPGSIPSPGNSNQKHMFASMVRERLPTEEWNGRFKFAVVRNPHDRVVSLYGLFRRPTEKSRQDVLKVLHQDRYDMDAKQPYKLDKLMSALIHADSSVSVMDLEKNRRREIAVQAFRCDFKSWLTVFCEEWRWNGCRYLDAERSITRIQQVEWFDGLDHVFRFEQMEELQEFLVDRGYPAPVPENQTKHEPWRSYYDAQTFDLVSEVFKDDIARFGY